MTKIIASVRTPSQQSNAASSQQIRRVSRCLFGRPKPGETDQYLRKELGLIQQESRSKWGFDFTADHPVLPASTSCQWNWSSLDSASVPSFYRATDTSEKSMADRLAGDSLLPNSNSGTPTRRKTPEENSPSSSPARIPPPGSPKKRTRLDQFFGCRKRCVDGSSPKSSSQPVTMERSQSDEDPVSAKVSRFSSSQESVKVPAAE